LIDKNARGSLQIIDRIGLWSTIFTDPTANSLVVPDTKNWHLVYDCFQQLESHSTPGSIYQSLVRSPDARYFSWMLVALTPWSAISGPTVKPGAKPPPPLIAQVAREGIKAESKTCSLIAGAFRNFPDINALRDAILKKETWTNERDKVGMSIRKWDSQGGHWRLHVLFALLVETFNGASSTGTCFYSHAINLLIFSRL
jgi:tRNA nucleotidyltransferase (CCA-adding enzyme)